VRSSKATVPGNDFKVLEGDRVFIMAMPEVISKVKKLFLA
jgi:Trk K+ transport system NAD-binding subunit